ncbi:MAG: peptide-methionine (S)-S-oxide reductase MsrA [Dehalococcoidia bacterium]
MRHVTRSLASVAVLLSTVAPPGGAQSTSRQAGTETAIFAAGCFWCVEEAFDKVPGVVATTSGYTGGRTEDPSYEEVSSGGTGHTEAVQVTYDPARVSYESLLATFWRNVDAVDGGGQFCDRGSQYRSGIYVASAEERRLAEASKAKVAAQLGKPVATEIEAAGAFYPAETYHQDYYTKNPVRYRFYKWSCGRAQRLEALWGPASR